MEEKQLSGFLALRSLAKARPVVQEKVEQKAEAQKWSPADFAEDQPAEAPKRKKRERKEPGEGPNSTDVYNWFKDAMADTEWGKDLQVSRWEGKQRTLAMRLLDEWGSELVKEAVFHFHREWMDYCEKSKGRLRGIPSIELLYSMRSAIFGQVQLERKGLSGKGRTAGQKANSDEYKSELPGTKKTSGMGWGF